MENFMGDKKEIIIVYDDKIKEYADYLFDLISTKENIDAARWSIKEYEQSKASISSKNYTIFIGNNELIQNKIKFISNFQFDENGKFYGWLGKSAILLVKNTPFSKEEIERLRKIVLDIKWYSFIPFLNPFTSFKMTKKVSEITKLRYIELINIFCRDSLEKFLGE